MNDKKDNLKDVRISFWINIVIAIFTLVASIIMFTGFKFMYLYEPILESTKIGMLRFFTVQSNIFMGIVALVFAFKERKVLNGEISDISTKMYILKLMSTTAVGLTFFVVFTYLGPISKEGIPSLLMNSNLFFHLIIPVLSMLNFAIYERTNKLKFKYTFLGVIPTILYAVYYIINVLIHMENGKASPIYDWYWFVQNGVWFAIIVAPMILLITYIISLILWRLNKRK